MAGNSSVDLYSIRTHPDYVLFCTAAITILMDRQSHPTSGFILNFLPLVDRWIYSSSVLGLFCATFLGASRFEIIVPLLHPCALETDIFVI